MSSNSLQETMVSEGSSPSRSWRMTPVCVSPNQRRSPGAPRTRNILKSSRNWWRNRGPASSSASVTARPCDRSTTPQQWFRGPRTIFLWLEGIYDCPPEKRVLMAFLRKLRNKVIKMWRTFHIMYSNSLL